MSEWKDVTTPGSDFQRHLLVVEQGTDGKPTVWVSADLRNVKWPWWERSWDMCLSTPRIEPARWEGDTSDHVEAAGDFREECLGKTAAELRELFRQRGAA